jgi:hypothetical protein
VETTARQYAAQCLMCWMTAAIGVLRTEYGFTAEQANDWAKKVGVLAAEQAHRVADQDGTQPAKVTGKKEIRD